ncbi:uncharacterized protein KIAA0895-like [Lingula anatina]|uniref:Uncharacterized protein KIAA0895-like n=1 Tax=Lingula anatina TaxID=7574 RepID=A0A1S3HCN0_LINAN|nr:uncharacterized protein KIAA0895-like [Lingula anatina]|eukprot:XP_013383783.1 uncharacterized protein KIAA0895-like [Lingula anatina]
METAIAKYGSYETFEEKTGGKPMSRTQIMAMVLQYLRKENLEEEISVNMSEVLMSRASMTNVKGKPTLNVRVWNLREHWVDGLLRHEVGTHYIRSYNNQFQPWYNWKKRKELDMEPINPTEEGLAALHSILVRKDPSLWRAAILYYTTYWAAHMSLRDLFKDLGRFVQDPHTRWDYCMRTKRGQTDTSQPGGFSKDQVYLTGALELLRYRHSIDFHALARLGKVSYKDVDKLKNMGDFEETRIPYFMQDTNWYLGRLDHIVRANGLTDAELKRVVPDLDDINLKSCGSASSFNY